MNRQQAQLKSPATAVASEPTASIIGV
jgi:hypothetical protein